MALIVVVGPDAALLEGLSQTLVGAGYEVMVATEIPEAIESLRGEQPLMAVVHRDELVRSGAGFRLALAKGGALLSFQTDDTEQDHLPFAVKRATLAELRLPLERHRLLALAQHVESRLHITGRDATDDSIAAEELRD